jgi:DNA-binding NtrC family response regulator
MPKVLMLEEREGGLQAERACDRDSSSCRAASPRVMVVANNQLLRDALEAALAATTGLEVVVTAETAEDLPLAAVHDYMADVLLMDIAASREATVGHVRDLAASCPHLKIVIIDVVHAGCDRPPQAQACRACRDRPVRRARA